MKVLLIAALLALTPSVFHSTFSFAKAGQVLMAESPKPPKADKVKIRSSIQCGQCIERINAELPKINGVKSVQYDLTKKLVIVRYNSAEVSADQIRTALTRVGYDADGMAADPQAYQNLPTCCKKGGH